jgi:2-polyprenyl-3-methyl-5-hydroxy-6-metoxy-1,4-benzoquinol methylase
MSKHEKYLAKTYAAMARELAPSDDYFVTDSRFMTLEVFLRSIPSGKLCDMGCGRGALMKRLRDHHDVSGCEFEPTAIEACLAEGLTAKRIDLNNDEIFPYAEQFDVIVISEVCEHLLNPRNAFCLAKSALKKGGTFLVTVPNALPLFVRLPAIFGQSMDWLHFPSSDTEKTGHIRFYTIESMARLLSEEGFRVEQVRGISFRMNGHFWAQLCYWVAKLLMYGQTSGPARVDAWLGKQLPGLSPGLLFSCRLM